MLTCPVMIDRKVQIGIDDSEKSFKSGFSEVKAAIDIRLAISEDRRSSFHLAAEAYSYRVSQEA